MKKDKYCVIFVPKDKYYFFFPLCKFPGIGKFTETEGKMMVTKIWAGRLGRCSLLGTYRVSVWVDKKKFWKIVVMVAQYCEGP